MGSKITSFILSVLMILIFGVLIFIGYTFYKDIAKTSVADKVENFVSNIVTESGGTDQNTIKTPQIQEVQIANITASDEKIDYSTSTINKYFYSQLNDYQKIIYNALDKNKENMKSGTYEVNLGTEFSDLLSQDGGSEKLSSYYQTAVEAYTYDNPDVFYIDFQKIISKYRNDNKNNIKRRK